MKFSLVLATLGRVDDLERFFESLKNQIYKDFEVIVIDQNQDDRLNRIIKAYKNELFIIHKKSSPGLSYARNIGLKHVTGDVLAFPDDDCWYPPILLEQVSRSLSKDDIDGVSGMCIDENGDMSVTKFSPKTCIVNRNNVFETISSITFFLKRKGELLFDENLGVGAKSIYGAGEDVDFVLRYLDKGNKLIYNPEIKVCHPQSVLNFDENAQKKGFFYGAGLGYLLKKHEYPLSYFLNIYLRGWARVFINMFCFNIPKAKFYISVTKGRRRGWLSR